MKLEGYNIQYLQSRFGRTSFYDSGNHCAYNFDGSEIEMSISENDFLELKHFAKRYKIDGRINDLGAILFHCQFTIMLGKNSDNGKNSNESYERNSEWFKAVPILKNEVYEISIKGKEGKIKIRNSWNIFAIKYQLRNLLHLPDESLRSYTKKAHLRVYMKMFAIELIEVFTNDIPIPHKSNLELYSIINDFFIIAGYSIQTSKKNLSSPEELIKRLINS